MTRGTAFQAMRRDGFEHLPRHLATPKVWKALGLMGWMPMPRLATNLRLAHRPA
jgi:hypothetical protein